jgi:hypothetical protein
MMIVKDLHWQRFSSGYRPSRPTDRDSAPLSYSQSPQIRVYMIATTRDMAARRRGNIGHEYSRAPRYPPALAPCYASPGISKLRDPSLLVFPLFMFTQYKHACRRLACRTSHRMCTARSTGTKVVSKLNFPRSRIFTPLSPSNVSWL